MKQVLPRSFALGNLLLGGKPITWERIRHALAVILMALALPIGLLIAALIISVRTGFVVSSLVRDPASIMGVSPFTGMFSDLGIVLWAAAATICYLAWAILRHRPGQSEHAGLFLWGAILTTLLGVDDLFLLHEEVLWKAFHFGEKQLYITYLLIGLFGAIRFRKAILESEYLYLVAAIGLLALSTGIDALRNPLTPWDHIIEETPKWLGIATWLLYWGAHFYHKVNELIQGEIARTEKSGCSSQ